jgi:hypothetical protein
MVGAVSDEAMGVMQRNKLEEYAHEAAKKKQVAEATKQDGKNSRRKTSVTKTATEVALGLRAQEAEAKSRKAEENYIVLWELSKYLYAEATNTSTTNAGDVLTNLILYGEDFERHIKTQKGNLDGMLYNLRRYIANKKRTEAMRKAK